MRSVLLIGKGPSAQSVPGVLRRGEHIACINDSVKLVPEPWPVHFCFFIDIEQVEAVREHAHRVQQWVCPWKLHRNCAASDAVLPEWIPAATRYPYERCDPPQFQQRVRDRRICMFSTACAAMCWLAYEGFEQITLIGFDGGNKNAAGVKPGIPPGFDYSGFKRAQQDLSHVLRREMRVKIQWLC